MNELNHGWEMGSGWIVGIIVLVIILGLVAIVMSQKKNNRLKEKSPLDIIKERYARGEISKEEFEEKRRSIL